MNQTSCVGKPRGFYFNDEGDDEMFNILCQLHNIN